MKKLLLLLMLCIGFASLQAQEKKMHKPHAKDCMVMQDGKMMTMMGGQTMAMERDTTLRNGTMVMTDGTVKMKNGKTVTLKNGECVMMDGTIRHTGVKKMVKHKTTKSKT